MRHRDPHLLLETLLTLVVYAGAKLARYALYSGVAVYVRYRPVDVWSAVRLPRMEAFLIFSYRYRGLAHAVSIRCSLTRKPT